MKAFKGLLIKELKLTKTSFLVNFLSMLFVVLVAIGLERYFQRPEILAVSTMTLFFLHIFYMPVFLLSSLKIEAETKCWLHNPNSGFKLLMAKLCSGLIYFFFSIFTAFILTRWGIYHIIENGIFVNIQITLLANLVIFVIGILLVTLYMGVWILFYWTFYQVIKNIPKVKAFRWPIIIGIWIALSGIGNYIKLLPFYQKLQQSGSIKLASLPLIKFETGNSSFRAGLFDTVELSIFNGVVYTVITIVVFLSAVWLLERKVEV